MPYALIVIAVLLAGCGESNTSSKSASLVASPMSASVLGRPAGEAETTEGPTRNDKGDGLIVEVLQEGTGRVVNVGDMVTLEYTVSYVPSAASKEATKDAKDGKSSRKSDDKKGSKKTADKKGSEEPKPAEDATGGDPDKADGEKKEAEGKEPETTGTEKKDTEKKDTEKKDTEKKDTEKKDAETEAPPKKDEAKDVVGDSARKEGDKPAPEKSEKSEKTEKPELDTTKSETSKTDTPKTDDPAAKTGDDAAQSDKKPDEKPAESPAEAKIAEPLKPVIVFSTKSLMTPMTVKLSTLSKPKLVPGFVRAIEGLKVGTRARITVPAALAYGKEGSKSAGIPGDTPLVIEVFVKEARE